MYKNKIYKCIGYCCISIVFAACVPKITQREADNTVPEQFNKPAQDTTNSAQVVWKEYFKDSNLVALIDTALKNNQELNIILQDIYKAKNEVKARKGAYLPTVSAGAGAGVERAGEYTRNGAIDEQLDIKPGQKIPTQLPNYMIGAQLNWEVDIWKKLRNAKKVAMYKYLASIEGKNFMVTHLVGEIATAYYELLALDNQLLIIQQNIEIQQNAMKIVDLQKTAGMVTELAVRRFHAEVNKNMSHQYYIKQEIIETENRINFLVGRYPQTVTRDASTFRKLTPALVASGIPSQLLENRPDIRQAEQELEAAKLDILVAKANFYPSINIHTGVGYEAFNPRYLFTTPASLLFNLAGELVVPVINRNAIKAVYYNANAKQIEAAFQYEKTILNAYTEVVNQQSKVENLSNSYIYKEKQVDALQESINISLMLFNQARADYVEVLLTQRDALEAKMELVETKKQQMHASVDMYKALGGGWK